MGAISSLRVFGEDAGLLFGDKTLVFIQNQRHTERGTETLSYQDGRTNLIAFSRGAKGWLAINNSVASSTRTFQTGIAPGTYCDIIDGSYRRGPAPAPRSSSGRTARRP